MPLNQDQLRAEAARFAGEPREHPNAAMKRRPRGLRWRPTTSSAEQIKRPKGRPA